MSKLSHSKLSNGFFKAFLGAVAAALALGAVHLEVASGNGLSPAPGLDAGLRQGLHDINRGGKADRLASARQASGQEMVFSYQVPAQDTLVVARIPVSPGSGAARPAAPSPEKAAAKSRVACELAVSSLVSVAKVLSPGRCMA